LYTSTLVDFFPFFKKVGKVQKVEKYAKSTKSKGEARKFIEQGGWRARMGGRGLPNGGNRVVEIVKDDKITFGFTERRQQWLDVCPILGPVVARNNSIFSQIIDGQEFNFSIMGEDGNTVTYWLYSRMNRFVLSHIRGVANKVAYCFGCKACEVQCPVNAFTITDNGSVFIREDLCVHCYNCIEYTNGKGCLAAKSLSTTEGKNGMDLKGMNRYQHFGLRRPWLEHFFEFREECFIQEQLGKCQYDSLKVWLREAGLLFPAGKGEKSGTPTPLFEKIERLGAGNPLVWAIVWTNLAYNSIITKWFMLNVPSGEIFEKNELVFQLGDDYSKSTRDNAITALLETFRFSPIGSVLKQGIPIANGVSFKFSKQGWNSPDAVAILYALYMWAEATGRYDFTLSQLEASRGKTDVVGVDPIAIFGINSDKFKDILQDVAIAYPDYIRTTFVADLDNVKLFSNYKSVDVLDLIQK